MAELEYGWAGKLLKVDLATGIISIIPTSDYATKYIGGRLLGARIHWDMVGPDVKAFDPENVITFMLGPGAGTLIHGSRCLIGAVTGIGYPVEHYMKSNLGGYFGSELKYAGWDGIIVVGKASSPVYLLIEDSNVEIRDAGAIWGQDTMATQQNLWKRHSDRHQIATIGPAGENLVRTATIVHTDSCVASLGGFGAVMGAKNLKAIVIRGTGSVKIADPEKHLEYSYYAERHLTRKDTETDEIPCFNRGKNLLRYLEGYGNSVTTIWREADIGTARIGYNACTGCPVACGISVRLNDGSETAGGNYRCGTCIPDEAEREYYGSEDAASRPQWSRHVLEERLGLPCFNGTVDWPIREPVMALISKGILTKENTGLENFDKPGSVEFYRELMYKTAYREGIGDALAEGPARFCCEYLGTQEAIETYQWVTGITGIHGGHGGWNMHYACPGLLSRAVSNVSGGDIRGIYTFWILTLPPELGIVAGSDEYMALMMQLSQDMWGSQQAAIDGVTYQWGDYTAAMSLWHNQRWAMIDTFGCCMYLYFNWLLAYAPNLIADRTIQRNAYTHVTGISMSEEEEKTFANKVYMIERAILMRQGHTREDDWYFDSCFENEDYVSHGLSAEGLRNAQDEYYALRGMDSETAFPKRSTFEALDLKDIADDLEEKYGISLPA
jgi:aldehyde:ferredoxin oxidoreductase